MSVVMGCDPAAGFGCSIEGCEGSVLARCWCSKHYGRWLSHGDPLGGGAPRTPKGEPLRFFREVVLLYDGIECLIWPYSKAKGQGRLEIDGVSHGVSRLVCIEIYGPPPTPEHEAAHGCGRGDFGCCAKRHLSWKTHAENESDKLIHGTHNRGERHPLSKLTEPEILEIRSLKGKAPLQEVADRFGTCPSNVSQIQNLQSWAWL